MAEKPQAGHCHPKLFGGLQESMKVMVIQQQQHVMTTIGAVMITSQMMDVYPGSPPESRAPPSHARPCPIVSQPEHLESDRLRPRKGTTAHPGPAGDVPGHRPGGDSPVPEPLGWCPEPAENKRIKRVMAPEKRQQSMAWEGWMVMQLMPRTMRLKVRSAEPGPRTQISRSQLIEGGERAPSDHRKRVRGGAGAGRSLHGGLMMSCKCP